MSLQYFIVGITILSYRSTKSDECNYVYLSDAFNVPFPLLFSLNTCHDDWEYSSSFIFYCQNDIVYQNTYPTTNCYGPATNTRLSQGIDYEYASCSNTKSSCGLVDFTMFTCAPSNITNFNITNYNITTNISTINYAVFDGKYITNECVQDSTGSSWKLICDGDEIIWNFYTDDTCNNIDYPVDINTNGCESNDQFIAEIHNCSSIEPTKSDECNYVYIEGVFNVPLAYSLNICHNDWEDSSSFIFYCQNDMVYRNLYLTTNCYGPATNERLTQGIDYEYASCNNIESLCGLVDFTMFTCAPSNITNFNITNYNITANISTINLAVFDGKYITNECFQGSTGSSWKLECTQDTIIWNFYNDDTCTNINFPVDININGCELNDQFAVEIHNCSSLDVTASSVHSVEPMKNQIPDFVNTDKSEQGYCIILSIISGAILVIVLIAQFIYCLYLRKRGKKIIYDKLKTEYESEEVNELIE